MPPPTGTVTFLFTDIEGSSPLWERHPQGMETALTVHNEILGEAIERNGGFVFKTVGDAFCAAFSRVDMALGAAIDAQKQFQAHEWRGTGPLRVRMAIHTGTVEERGGDYFGPPLNRVARILEFGHGGQVLISQTSARLLSDRPPTDVTLNDLGEHRLKGLGSPERIFRVLHPDLPGDLPPLRTQVPPAGPARSLHLKPRTRYARTTDDVRIAYQVLGKGGVDLVFVPGWISHVELNWREPSFAAFLERLAEFSRVVVIDKRGTGCSDRVDSVPDLETRMDDVRAVLDAEGFERVVLFGESSGAAMSALFAATYPGRTRALVLNNARARTRWSVHYPWGMRPEEYAQEERLTLDGWDSGEFVRSVVVPVVAPLRAKDEAFVRRITDYYLTACTRDDAVAMNEMWWDIDYRAILPSISVPTLLLGAPGSEAETEYLASRIPGSRHASLGLPGAEMWNEGSSAVTDAIRDFLATVVDEEADFDRVLSTVLLTSIVDSTAHAATIGDRRWEALRQQHDEIVASHLARFRGNAIKGTGEGILATFDGPARAIRCGLAIAQAVERLGIQVRVGLHTGEVEFQPGEVRGITVSIAAMVAGAAGPGQVLVSQTVKDLVAGSGLFFEDSGVQAVKGLGGSWRLYRTVGQPSHQETPRTLQAGGTAQPPPPLADQRQGLPARLTAREAEVLRLIGRGLSNRGAAAELVLSERTVERHVANVYAKIGAHSRAEATAFAIRNGIL